MRTYLFVNPTSGHHSSQRLEFSLERLRSASIIPEVFKVRTPKEIYTCCAKINSEREPHLVIVAGGDGTFNAVVNGLEPAAANTLAVLPFGTSNVLAAEIGITSIDDALERIITGKSTSLSVGVLEMEERSLRFVLMAGIGLDGAVVRDVWPLGKRLLRQGAYALSGLKQVITWNPAVFTVATAEIDVTCHSAIICNASRYGGNFILAPGKSPFESGLSAVCITGNTRSTYLECVMKLIRGTTETSKNLRRIHATAYHIQGNLPIQIDGDFVGYGPAHISEYIDFARIIV